MMKLQQSATFLPSQLVSRGPNPQVAAAPAQSTAQVPKESVELSTTESATPRPWGKILAGTALSGGIGTLLGAGMASGGVGGFISGVLAGSALGVSTIGPMGNGKGAEGLLYAGSGLLVGGIAGGLAGAAGLPHGALVGGATFGLLTLGKSLTR